MIPKICALGLLFALVGVLLSEFGFKEKKLFSVLCAVSVISVLGGEIASLLSSLLSLGELTGVSEIATASVKLIGVGYVFGVSSSIIRELSEPVLANAVTIGGKVETALIVMPYFVEIIELGAELIK